MHNITIEIAYMTCNTAATLICVQIKPNSTALSVLTEILPELPINEKLLSVFSIPISLDYILQPNDRLEITRPLTIDPKIARRLKAMAKMAKQSNNKNA